MKKLLIIFLMILFYQISSAQFNLDSVLLGYWPFNGNAKDYSFNGNNGSVIGATLTTDRFGQSNKAYFFNGLTNYISAGTNINPAKMTVAMWFKSNSSIGARMLRSRKSGFEINMDTAKHLYFQFYTTSTATTFYQTPFAVNDNIWHFAAFSYNEQKAKYYFDGVLMDSSSITSNGVYYDGAYLAFGRDGDRSGDYFKGSLDDIRINGRALSDAEVLALFNENKCIISVEDTLHIDVTITGLTPPNNQNTIMVYPNPAKDNIIINTGNYSNMNGYSIKIINSLGQTVWQNNITQQIFTISVNSFHNYGIYYLQVIDPSSKIITVRKIVLQ